MSDLYAMTAVQTGSSLSILGILVAVGFWLMSIYRDRIDDDQEGTAELLSNFKEMAREGDISSAEFRTLGAVMGEKRDSGADRSLPICPD